MIDARSNTTRSTRLRKVKKTKGNTFGELSNGLNSSNGEISHNNEESYLDRSWNVMSYSDYVNYSRPIEESVSEKSLIDTLFRTSTVHGFAWDTLEDVQRRRSGTSSLETSKANTSYEEGGKSSGFIFKYYKKFGYYWNVFPKTDYCYLPGSPNYQKEVSPGIPKVPNLSREPLTSYIKRGAFGNSQIHETGHSDSRVSFSEASFKSSTKLETTSNSGGSNQNWLSIEARQNIINSSLSQVDGRSSWRHVKRLTQTFLSVIKKTILMSFTSVSYVSTSLVSNREGSKLPLLLFFIFLLSLLYFFVPGYVHGSQGEDVTTAVSSHAGSFLSWSSDYVSSILILVKESVLYIPTIYQQIAALFASRNSSSSHKGDGECTDSPAKSDSPVFPVLNLSKDITEEKLIALQTEIVKKLKTELAGRNYDITSRIQQLQQQMALLTEDMKKMSNQFEGDWKSRFNKLEEELTGLKKDVVDVRDTAIGSISTPSEKMVEKIVAKYHADRTGKPDYALQSSGGYIVRVRCAQTYTRTTAQIYMFGLPLPWDVFNGPETIIKPGVMPGECWAFEGSFAQVTLHLATKVKVTGFSLEHSPTELSLHGHISSAPKQFSVWALETENDENPVFLGRFNFLDNGQSLQQFDAITYEQTVDLIELKVESNHGHPEYTCIYRFRVHGVPPTLDEVGANSTGLSQNPGDAADSKADSHSRPYR